MQHTLRWFKNRIKTKIYRDPLCKKKCCKGSTEFLTIMSLEHARYLYEAQGELKVDYRDEK